MIVILEDMQKALDYLASIESIELKDIEWSFNGKPVAISYSAIEHWHFVGLNNRDFAKEFLLPNPENAVFPKSDPDELPF